MKYFHSVATLLFFLAATNQCLQADDNDITYSNDGKSYVFLSGKKPILKYNHAVIQPPKGIDPLYARSGHIHPLYTPNGKIVTDDFSDDHAHQHGLFNAFVKAKVEGESLDFWNQHKKTANVKHVGVTTHQVKSKLTTHQEHFRNKDNKTIFKEDWTIEPTLQQGCFVIDLTIQIKNVTDKKVVVQKNHYGSFGLRGSGQWRQPKETEFDFTTASGKHRDNGNQSREKWVCLHGKIDGADCGVAVIGHPENFRHPQPARLHPKMPYFSFAPMSLDSFEIKPGSSYKSRFRIVTFDGKLDANKLNQLAKFNDQP